eukprot:TRINITY_DN14501_c0_g1_i1.p1 TRINITY_DN14501_c0_g1~~TRINITY_DN14501_c0_g1_i1.p1  ORF type:complete len:120 (+),score=33.95 TRINITY_DN14501_c0_g1_i1:30-362(+)
MQVKYCVLFSFVLISVAFCIPGGYSPWKPASNGIYERFERFIPDIKERFLETGSQEQIDQEFTLLRYRLQVVAGVKYAYEIKIGDFIYVVEIHEQPWLDSAKIVSFNIVG